MTDSNIKALRGPILVLGGGGFIGANLLLRLYAQRQDVYAVVRKTPCWRLNGVVPDRIFEVDLTDRSAMVDLLSTIRPQTVFDCAAYGGYSFEEDYLLIHKTNFLAAVDLLEHLAQEPFAAYIHAGSSSEYGLNCAAPREDAPAYPNSHYSVSKVAMSGYLRYLGTVRGLPVANLRLYSVYGPLEDTSRLMPQLLRHALAGGYPPLVNRDTSRDFVYVSDVVNAFIMAAVRMHPEMYGKSYNIGTGGTHHHGRVGCPKPRTLSYQSRARVRLHASKKMGLNRLVRQPDPRPRGLWLGGQGATELWAFPNGRVGRRNLRDGLQT